MQVAEVAAVEQGLNTLFMAEVEEVAAVQGVQVTAVVPVVPEAPHLRPCLTL